MKNEIQFTLWTLETEGYVNRLSAPSVTIVSVNYFTLVEVRNLLYVGVSIASVKVLNLATQTVHVFAPGSSM